MAAQKGKDVLMKINTSGSTYVTIGGTLLAGAGVNSITVSGSGVFTDDTAEQLVRTSFQAQQNTSDGSSAQTPAFKNFQFSIPDLGTYTGAFMIQSITYAGEFNGEATYDMSFESAGYITFA
mgnify:CR=1 FL=1